MEAYKRLMKINVSMGGAARHLLALPLHSY
eukprot:SAG22_NODE_710_length_7741_cov_108.460089_4_plen_30_part_00